MKSLSSDAITHGLAILYACLAIAAGARSVYQIAVRFDEAPAAVSLSLVAALVYLVAFSQLRRRTPGAWWIAVGATSFELVGVVVVGTVSLVSPELFERATVWSTYGIGYAFVPLLLPIAGLSWLTRPRARNQFGVGA
jgi:hypothetical protein